MAHRSNHKLDRSLQESSKDFQMWPLNSLNRATSTPLCRRSLVGKNTPNRKYSLASISNSSLLNPNKHSSQRSKSFDSSKRLYESYLSTHIDTQSPGFATRIVRYKEEQEKATNSRHYGLGNFPIVHFFKKDPPVLGRKSLQMNDFINSTELSSFNTAEQNKLLLEKIVRPNSDKETVSSHKPEPNTKSVLDALREISRKRIHSDQEDYSFSNDGKRPCLDFDKEITPKNERPRVQAEHSKGIKAMIDELTASFSSTVENHSFSPPAKKKPIARVTSPYVPAEEPKQKECVDVETQTPVQEPPSVKPISIVRKETDNTAPECVTDKQQVEEPPPPPPVAVFAEKPLETMRKNRLMILLGGENTLGNSSSIVSTAPDSLKETTFPVSILTTKKSPHKSEKHVTFNIPSTTEGSGENVALGSDKITPVCVVTTTTVSLVTPIVFPSVSEASISTSSFNSANTSNNILQIAVSDAIAVATTSFQSKSAFNTTDSLNSSFGIPAQNPPSASNNLNVVTTTASSQFVFNSPDSKTTFSSSIPTLPAASTSSGGFKFDLKEAKSNDIKTTVASESAVTTSSFFSMPPNNVTVSNPVAINVTVTTSSTPSFSFIATSTAAPPPTVGFSFPAPASTSSGFTLPGNTLVPSFTVAPTTSTLAPSFTLPKATAANTTKGFSFANNTNSLIGFSAPSTTAIPIAPIGGFNMPAVSTNAPTTTSGFAFTTPPSTSAFGFNKSDPVTTKTGFAFGSTNFSSTTAPNPITSSFINAPSAITTNAAFQSETPNFSFSSNMTNAPLFPSFGASATAATSTFTNTLSTFGFMTNNTKPSFNTTITSTAAPPLFSTTPATTVPTPFTVPKQASSSINFGFIKTDNNAFGTTNPPQSLFDTTKTLPTPATTASVFAGNVVQSPFAPTANKPVFGFSATTPNIPAFPSGSSSIVPGVTKDVGATPKNIFGSFATTSTPAFGTAQTSAFPSTTTNQFSFGNTAFKPNALPFATGKEIGVTTAPAVAFGQTSTFSTSFGAGGGAVSSQKSASFGPNTNNNNAFGSKSFPATTQPSSDVFTFGSNAPSAGVFSFGASEPPRAATFNFGADNNSNNNVFGTNQAFATAAPQAPSFGAGNTNNNTQAAAVPGMFNIGTGFTPSGRQRLQLRAKRRT